jgi:hypothetical protein
VAVVAAALLMAPSSCAGTGQAAPDFPAQVVQELAALRAATTPAAWLRAHPTDSLVRFERGLVLEGDDRWCARAIQRTTLAGGTPVVRYAYFYPPAPPPDLALPPAEDPRLIREQCRLGVIWIETPAAGALKGSDLAAKTRDALTGAYGPVRASPNPWLRRAMADSSRRAALSELPGAETMLLGLDFLGSAYWRVPGRWQADSSVIGSAYDEGLEPGRERVLAFGFLPFAKLGAGRRELDREGRADQRAFALAAQAARRSGIDSGRVSRLLAVSVAAESAYRSDDPDRGRARLRSVDTLLKSGLTDWITASQGLDAPHRAAALLAADQIIGSGAVGYVLAQDSAAPIREALTGLGARFAEDRLGGGETYTHTWLDEAQRLDSAGPVGRLATLVLLRLGFNRSGMCGGTENASRRVSAMAEQQLGSAADPVEVAELHVLAGNGYADIVALASGVGQEYADSSAYAPAAPEARRRAIQHYRQGLRLDARSSDSRAAWLTAWRLLAGLPPTGTHFFCVYD